MPDSKDLKDLDSQLKKTIISAESFKRGSSVDFSKGIQKTTIGLAGHVRQLVAKVSDIEKIVNNNFRKITSLKNISKTQSSRISGENIGAKLPGSSTSNVEDSIATITKSVTSIAEILAGRKKTLDNAAAFDRRKAEQEKRGLAEDKLEKRFEGLKSAAEKVIAPVKSILDKIIDFFVTVFLGRVVYKLLEWFGDKKNADKVRAIGRFLGDHWPKLLALYITFGTSFGRFALGLTKVVARGAVSLLSKILLLSKAKKLRAAGKFLGGGKGRGLAGVLATTAVVGGTYAATQGLGGDGEDQKIQGLAGGGFVIPKIPKFSGGGLNFKGMLGGMFAKPQEMSSGFVSGEKGVDKVPAMLSDGEFVMSTGAVQKYGVDTLEAMNAAGGGTNKPNIMNGTTYAAGGGLIGNDPIQNVKNFIKHKLGYDVDKPSTWGASFGAGISGMSGSSGSRMSGPDLSGIASQLKGASQQGLTLANQAYRSLNDPRLQQNVLSYGQRMLAGAKNKALSIVDSPLASFEKYGTERENSLIKSGELKPGAALTKTAQSNLNKSDAWIKSLYDPKKDKGPMGFAKKAFQDVQNKGLLADPFAMLGLKEEGTEKFVEKISGGRVKNLGAKITGLQYALKGLAGPLGKAFRIDDRGSLGRYVRPAMLEAQRRGKGGVGAVGLGQTDYNRLMGDKLANLALGQFNFGVDKKGRATTDDTYEANKPASEYFKGARSALKSGDIGGALFKGVSGLLRINQNTGWGNLRPGGLGIDLGGGFTPTDDKGNPISPTKSKSPVIPNKSFYGPGGDPTGTGRGQAQQAQISRSKPKNVRGVRPSTAPKPKVVYGPPVPKKRNVRGGRASTKTPNFSASNPHAHRSKQETLGLMR